MEGACQVQLFPATHEGHRSIKKGSRQESCNGSKSRLGEKRKKRRILKSEGRAATKMSS